MTYSFYNPQHTCMLSPRSAVTQARLPAPPLAPGTRLSCLLLYRWALHLWQVHWLHTNQWWTLAKWLGQIGFVIIQRRRRRSKRRALRLQGKRDVIWGDCLRLLTLLQAVLEVKWKITVMHLAYSWFLGVFCFFCFFFDEYLHLFFSV